MGTLCRFNFKAVGVPLPGSIQNLYRLLFMTCDSVYFVIMSKIPKTALSLKQFLLRQEVLKLYREIFRTIKQVPDKETQKELKEWARTDFRNNMHHNDEVTIKTMLYYGKKSLKDFQNSVALSKG